MRTASAAAGDLMPAIVLPSLKPCSATAEEWKFSCPSHHAGLRACTRGSLHAISRYLLRTPRRDCGLRRFGGQVVQQARGFALVRYDELHEDAEGEQPLQEWFLVPGAADHDVAGLRTKKPVHEEPGYLIRPEPPAKVRLHLGPHLQHSA